MKEIFDLNPMTYIQKGWGRADDSVGEIFAYHVEQEKAEHQIDVDTVKLLYMNKDKKLSRHFHKEKDEFFICVDGSFYVELWFDSGEPMKSFVLKKEQRIFVPKGIQHRMTGLETSNILLEVSTKDSPSDSYRIERGD